MQHYTIAVDTREQAPYRFAGEPVASATLAAGDYSLAGLEHLIAVERKELGDLVGCMTHDRDRFKRELQRLRAYRYRAGDPAPRAPAAFGNCYSHTGAARRTDSRGDTARKSGHEVAFGRHSAAARGTPGRWAVTKGFSKRGPSPLLTEPRLQHPQGAPLVLLSLALATCRRRGQATGERRRFSRRN